MNALTAVVPAGSIVATHFGLGSPATVPFTAHKTADKALPDVATTKLRNRAGKTVKAVEHCMYVIPHRRIAYSASEQQRLGEFIALQDLMRSFTSAVVGGFDKPVAYITKVHHTSMDYAYGKRWAYHVAQPDGSVRTVMENALEKLLTRLGRE